MDLTFQVPMQYCSLEHLPLLPSPVTSTTGHYFHFGSTISFFLELFLYWSPAAYWAPTDQGSLSFSVLSFCLFILFMGFPRQEYWGGLPFPSPVDHILSELFTMTRLSWVTLHGMARSFIESDKPVVHVISLISFLWLWFSFCLPSEESDSPVLCKFWWLYHAEHSWRAPTKPCSHEEPGERSSDPTRDWPRLAYECPGISIRGMGQRWSAAV